MMGHAARWTHTDFVVAYVLLAICVAVIFGLLLQFLVAGVRILIYVLRPDNEPPDIPDNI
jgi:5-bromo-4-chloroindolyl phosphate hydrolysis protein